MMEPFRIAQSRDDLLKIFMVRGIVFMEEQNISYALEVDEFEYCAVHILGEVDGEPMAAGRILLQCDTAKLERIAIRKAWRSQGYGRRLTQFMIQTAESKGYRRMELHAQTYAKKLYEDLGFTEQGAPFMEAGIAHCLMIRKAD